MKLNRLALLCCLGMGTFSGSAIAQVQLYLSDADGDAHQVQIAPGQSSVVHVGLGTMQELVGLSYWLAISESGSGLFSLTGREIHPECPYMDLITADEDLLEAANALLDPDNARDLGALGPPIGDGTPAGIYPLAAITITSSPSVPSGTYTLSIFEALGTNTDFESIPITGSTYTIVVAAPTGGGDPGTGGDPDTGGDPGTGGGTGSDPGTGGDPGTGSDPGTGGSTGSDPGTAGNTGSDPNTSDGTDNGGNTNQPGGGTTDDTPVNSFDDSTTGNEPSQSTSTEEATVARRPIGCGAGTGGGAGVAALLFLGLIRPTLRRR